MFLFQLKPILNSSVYSHQQPLKAHSILSVSESHANVTVLSLFWSTTLVPQTFLVSMFGPFLNYALITNPKLTISNIKIAAIPIYK